MEDETLSGALTPIIRQTRQELLDYAQKINRRFIETEKAIYNWVLFDLFTKGLAGIGARLGRRARRNMAHETLGSLSGVMEEMRMIQRMIRGDPSMANRGRWKIQTELERIDQIVAKFKSSFHPMDQSMKVTGVQLENFRTELNTWWLEAPAIDGPSAPTYTFAEEFMLKTRRIDRSRTYPIHHFIECLQHASQSSSVISITGPLQSVHLYRGHGMLHHEFAVFCFRSVMRGVDFTTAVRSWNSDIPQINVANVVDRCTEFQMAYRVIWSGTASSSLFMRKALRKDFFGGRQIRSRKGREIIISNDLRVAESLLQANRTELARTRCIASLSRLRDIRRGSKQALYLDSHLRLLLGRSLEGLNRLDEALDAYRYSVWVARNHKVDTILPVAIEALSGILFKLGRRDEVERLDRELLAISEAAHRAHGDDQSAVGLACSLHWRASHLLGLSECLQERREWLEESSALWRSLMEKQRDTHSINYARTLRALADLHIELGDLTSAFTYSSDALFLTREAFNSNPTAVHLDLISQLQQHSLLCGQLIMVEEARDCSQEAVEQCQILYTLDPQLHRVRLANVLESQARHLALDGHVNAVGPGLRALTLYRRLYHNNPTSHCAAYISHLRWVASICVGSDTHNQDQQDTKFSDSVLEEASIVEGVEEMRGKFAQIPKQWRFPLANALRNLAVHYSKHRQLNFALQPATRALTLYRHLYESDCVQYSEALELHLRWMIEVSESLRGRRLVESNHQWSVELLKAEIDSIMASRHAADST
ncbi:uncharacterized protein EI90DRAFT_3011207 [Cantharellus anzutake]|uniref:uncharacterized protein n=1 Tax=Cantharellus anzutake TaxID=1750568 RepID=UPI0019056E37|nr:uncharacterized protein EI90DRAFT_3011207 [Cantharellus anzutake]KAF8342706.1 hypothetical protein EI90DRAFT_3011207 [Cantharellus anzutake]